MFGIFVTVLAGIFWLFRIFVSLMYTNNTEFAIVPLNVIAEIILLFITFVCIVFIAKRKMAGAVIYLIAQGAYFGVDAYKNAVAILEGQPQTGTYISVAISIIAIIIPLLAIMNIGLNIEGKLTKKSKETDWFYGSSDYERKFDDRADRNQYKL